MVDVIERAFRVKAAGEVRMPPKVMITWADEPGTEEKHGRIMAMPAYVGGEFDVAGLKWIPSVPDNPSRNGLPRANALVLLTDPGTGLPLAVMDGTVVSAMRTGAVTGVAVRHLAAPGRRGGLPARRGRPGPHPARRAAGGAAAAARGARVRPGGRALQPVLRPRPRRRRTRRAAGRIGRGGRARRARSWCRRRWRSSPASPPGGSIPARPSCWSRAWTRRSTLQAVTDLLVVDDWEHESTHPGRYAERLVAAGLVAADGSAAVELADVVTGRHPGRTDAAQRIVVTPVGLAMDDVAAAWHVLRGARGRGLGTPLRLRSGPPVWE